MSDKTMHKVFQRLLQKGWMLRQKEKNGVVRITLARPPRGQLPLPLPRQDTPEEKA